MYVRNSVKNGNTVATGEHHHELHETIERFEWRRCGILHRHQRTVGRCIVAKMLVELIIVFTMSFSAKRKTKIKTRRKKEATKEP